MSSEVISRRLSAILAADMVGYSRLMGLDEAGTVARQKQCFQDLIKPKIREYEGRIVKTTGDGLLAEFPTAVGAVLCAVDVQREMIAREGSIPEDRRIVYRIGINLGDIIHDGDDIFGDGVNVAARLEALAEPGGISISESVFNTVKGKLDLGFADLGPQKVKNIADPIDTYQVLLNPGDAGKVVTVSAPRRWPGVGWAVGAAALVLLAVAAFFSFNRSEPAPQAGMKRLLVLPYSARDDAAELFADAASENLWLTLARVRNIEMVPRSEVTSLKGVTPDQSQISEFDGVTHVLDGSLSTSGDAVLLHSRLRDVGGSVVWEKTFDTSATELFHDLARAKLDVLSAMNTSLSEIERDILQKPYTTDLQAFLLYAEGWAKSQTGHWNDVGDALKLHGEALKLDPDFVEAKEEYAWNNFVAWRQSWNIVRFNLDAIADAERLVDELLADDPVNPTAVSIKVDIMLNRQKWDEALGTIRGAIFQDRDQPRFYRVLARALTADGQYKEARKAIDTFLETTPRLTQREGRMTSWHLLRMREPQMAVDVLNSVVAFRKDKANALWHYAEALSRLDRKDEAKDLVERIKQNYPPTNLTFIEPQFRSFRDRAVYDEFFEALNSVGLPRYAFGLGEKWADNTLTNAELQKLFASGFEAVETTDPVGGPYSAVIRADGGATFQYGFLPGMVFEGRWRIEGQNVCFQLAAAMMGHWFCHAHYHDLERSTPQNPRYIFLDGFGPHYFGVRRPSE